MSCFDKLVECASNSQEIINNYESKKGIASLPLQLSMGMSADYIEAITRGSTSVRVGSSIFWARSYSHTQA